MKEVLDRVEFHCDLLDDKVFIQVRSKLRYSEVLAAKDVTESLKKFIRDNPDIDWIEDKKVKR
jgi:hypothetical protein|tara:strand:+ start:300 stop:488 length:189 start_codon:yes stop_codon:yes gene_type:complete